MSSNTKGFIAVLVVGGLGYLLYKRLYSPERALLKSLNRDYPNDDNVKFVAERDKEYVKAWGKAIIKGQPTFMWKGEVRCIKSGRTPKDGICTA